MAAESSALEQLLHPLSLAQFFSQFWEKKPLLLQRKDADHFQHLMTRLDLETMISTSDMRYPAIELGTETGYIAPDSYTSNIKHGTINFAGVPNVQKISQHYRQGATVTLPAIHRTWAPLRVLCENLQSQLDFPVHANVYVTPGNAAGIAPHYDTHEVFALQIAGKKRWTLYEPPILLPGRSQIFSPQGYTPPAPMAQVDLSAGDLLYLPRGFVHSTTTSVSYSAHVTIGINVVTGFELAQEFLQSCIESPQLRQALPPGFASRSESKPLLRQKMIEALEYLRTSAPLDTLIDAFIQRVRLNRPVHPEPFRADVSVVDSQSRLQAPAPSEYRMMLEGANVVLEFKGGRYGFPAETHELLGAIAESSSVRSADLSESLNAQARLNLVRYLYDIGFLTLAG
jgi:ribosomal protein L16 Arg81 hydroxylase